MITVCLNEADFEYDIHSLVKAFYPAEDVKVFADTQRIEELEQQCRPLFRLEVYYRKGTAGCVDEIHILLREEIAGGCQMEERQSLFHAETEVNFTDRGDTKNRLKRCLYGLLSGYS